MAYSVKILLDSLGPSGKRLTTWELTYPRMVHQELLTHKIFSRNSASSRAIPAATLRKRVLDDPARPVWWGKAQKGMQAEEELSDEPFETRKVIDYTNDNDGPQPIFATDSRSPRMRAQDWWGRGLQLMAAHHEEGERLELHKQIVNRVLEPWMYVTVILTATEYGNWFALRDHEDAQPELRHLAAEMRRLYKACQPSPLGAGQWHIPMLDPEEIPDLLSKLSTTDPEHQTHFLLKVATGRIARVSYLTHDGVRDPGEDVLLHDRLTRSGHWSPFEHCAQAMTTEQWNEWVGDLRTQCVENRRPFEPSDLGNLVGFKQYRKLFYNEHRRHG